MSVEAGRQIGNFKQVLLPIKSVLDWLWSVLFSLLVIGAFVGIMYFTGARETWLWLTAKTWEQTQCEIDSVYSGRQEKTEGAGSTSVSISFKVSASYRYRNDFGAFTGRRYDFRAFRSSYQSVKKDLDYLRSNSKVKCYSNPRRPEQSVINRDFQNTMLIMLVPLFSMGGFAYLALASLLEKFGITRLFQRKQKRFLP